MPEKNHQLTETYLVTLVPSLKEVEAQENFNGNLFHYLNFLYEQNLPKKLNKELIESQKPKKNFSNMISTFFPLRYIKKENPNQSTFQSYIKSGV